MICQLEQNTFLKKKYAHDLTPEELLMSAILFRTYGSLVDTRD